MQEVLAPKGCIPTHFPTYSNSFGAVPTLAAPQTTIVRFRFDPGSIQACNTRGDARVIPRDTSTADAEGLFP